MKLSIVILLFAIASTGNTQEIKSNNFGIDQLPTTTKVMSKLIPRVNAGYVPQPYHRWFAETFSKRESKDIGNATSSTSGKNYFDRLKLIPPRLSLTNQGGFGTLVPKKVTN